MKKNRRRLRLHRETLRNLKSHDPELEALAKALGRGDDTGRICLLNTCACTPYCPWTGGCS